MTIAIHVTHEAVQKFGGIGTVIHGLLTSKKYQQRFPDTLLYTPLFHKNCKPSERLGENSSLLYSGLDRFDADKWSKIFAPIEKKYGVGIVYGKKEFRQAANSEPSIADIIVVDIWDMPESVVDVFKFKLWSMFGIQSDKFQHDRDYEQYLRIAIPLKDIIENLYEAGENAVLFSHEYMGMASALALEACRKEGARKNDVTIFYAHEVSTARSIVEKHQGHDLAFYNIMNQDMDRGISMEATFGSFSNFSRNELIKRATSLSYIFAVSDITKEEFLYLCPDADPSKIKVVYNGIPFETAGVSDKLNSLKKIRKYCENLYCFTPDYIFTHVARLVSSKGFWRDIRILYHVDEVFAKKGLKGFFVILSTLIGDGRDPYSVKKLEADYGWPVLHREGWPDLVGDEIDLYRQLELFNARSHAIKGVFLNQFGFSDERCGTRVPADATLLDLRMASDIEFGLSIYEPFGIAQLETMPYGGVPAVSTVCGCLGLMKKVMRDEHYVAVDFTAIPGQFAEILKGKDDFKNLKKELRDQIESAVCQESVHRLISALPKDDAERKKRFADLQKQCVAMDWEHVCDRVAEMMKLKA